MVEMAVTMPANSHGGANGTVTRIVIHDEEVPVSVNSAHSVAQFFADPSTETSAHYVVDADSIEHCVAEDVVAFHAPPNRGSIGIEHDGFAHFSAAEWAKPGSVATLARSAALVAEICQRLGIPVTFLSVEDLIAGKSGITTHANVTGAFHESTHTDPGDHFPMDAYLEQVRNAIAGGGTIDLTHAEKSPLLDQGATGQRVKDIQNALNHAGNTLAVDGDFGPKTEAALLAFQQAQGLNATGTTTPETWAALRKVAHHPATASH